MWCFPTSLSPTESLYLKQDLLDDYGKKHGPIKGRNMIRPPVFKTLDKTHRYI